MKNDSKDKKKPSWMLKEDRLARALDEVVANAALEKRLEKFLAKLKTPEKLCVADIKDIIPLNTPWLCHGDLR